MILACGGASHEELAELEHFGDARDAQDLDEAQPQQLAHRGRRLAVVTDALLPPVNREAAGVMSSVRRMGQAAGRRPRRAPAAGRQDEGPPQFEQETAGGRPASLSPKTHSSRPRPRLSWPTAPLPAITTANNSMPGQYADPRLQFCRRLIKL